MRRFVMSLLVGLVAVVGITLAMPATPSQAASYRTVCHGTESSGYCWQQRSAVVKKITVADAVPLINRSHKRATMHCSFSSTVSRQITLGGSASVTTTAEASFLKIAKASVSTTYTLHSSVTMTASSAKEAGGSVVLRPGQKVVCQRIYSHVVFSARKYTYSGTKVTYGATRSVSVPSTLGVRIVD